MSKGVIAEESLKGHLQLLAPSNGFVLGLILGQRSSQRDYVIHLPGFQTSQAKNDNDDTMVSEIQSFTSMQEVNVKNFVLYAKQVVAFLPGGMCILGIFSCGSGENGLLDQANSSKLQLCMNSLYTKLSADTNIFNFNSVPQQKVVMHFNSTAGKVTCKSVNLSDSKWYLSNMDWKFQAQPIKWQEIESRYVFDFKMPLEAKNGMVSLKSGFDELLNYQALKIKDSHCFLQGMFHDPSSTLDTVHTEDEDSPISAELHVACTEHSSVTTQNLKCSGDFVIIGHVYSRIYMHPKSTIVDVINALKEDIVSSLKTRFTLHTDALIEEEEGSPEEKIVQHDLPRRILISLPFSQVKLSNYLFPGETAKDSIASVQQVLGYRLDVDEVEEGLEEEADPDLLLPSEDIELSCPQTPQPEPEQSFMSMYTALAVVVLFLALCTTLLLIGDEDDDLPRSSQ